MGLNLKGTKSSTPLILTLITAGVFLIAAAFFPLLVHWQEAALASAEATFPPVVMEQAAPEMELTDLQGKPVALDDTLGKVVLVNNWATWCPPCQGEMPELQTYYQAHTDQDFLLVAIESGESAQEVREFVRKFGLTFIIWLDPRGAALEAFQNFNLPSSYVIDRQGSLRLSWTGPVTRASLEKYVTPLLER